jgi:UDP-N-acetylmuramate dehydrogenase
MGAAAVQNVGAYGVEIKDVVMEVSCYDTVDKQFKTIQASECGYGYRQSLFKQADVKGRYIITHVTIKLSKKACQGRIWQHSQASAKRWKNRVAQGIARYHYKNTPRKVAHTVRDGKCGQFFQESGHQRRSV